jgi:hypothetical protein
MLPNQHQGLGRQSLRHEQDPRNPPLRFVVILCFCVQYERRTLHGCLDYLSELDSHHPIFESRLRDKSQQQLGTPQSVKRLPKRLKQKQKLRQ